MAWSSVLWGLRQHPGPLSLLSLHAASFCRNCHGVTEKVRVHGGGRKARDELLSLTSATVPDQRLASGTQFRAYSEAALLGLEVLFMGNTARMSSSGELGGLDIDPSAATGRVPFSGH